MLCDVFGQRKVRKPLIRKEKTTVISCLGGESL